MVLPPSNPEKVRERFYSRLSEPTESGCREFQGARSPKGYGVAWNGERVCRAHRFAFELAYGPIPDGMLVMHSCDNPACCEPSHLSLGTPQQNTDDMMKKQRNRFLVRKGEAGTRAKLSEQDVTTIRELYSKGDISQLQLALQYGIHQTQVSNIVNYKQWA